MTCKKCGKRTDNIAYCNDCQKQFKKDIKKLGKKIELNPNDANLYSERGFAKYAIEQFEEAIEDFDKAIGLDKNNAGFYSNRGLCKRWLEQYKEAIKDFDEAIKLNPKNDVSYYRRANAKKQLEQYQEAINGKLATHTKNAEYDSDAVNVLNRFLMSDGKINTSFASNDKWPNHDGKFEYVADPE